MRWNSIGIVGKPYAVEESLATYQSLLQLCAAWQLPLAIDQQIGALLGVSDALCQPLETLMAQSDLILVVGGDGSMLSAAKHAVYYDKPVLGINRGRLGFLTDIGSGELEYRLRRVLEGDYWIEDRALLEGAVLRDQVVLTKHIALNDIVLSLGASSQLIEFDLWINECFVCRQRADGLIISTPTGSTAYALSAGGPIMHPALNAMAIVPMLPHKLSTRPIVISGDAQIKIVLKSEHHNATRVSFDSQVQYDMTKDDQVHIHRHAGTFKLVHPNDYDYFQTLRDKLHWENY